MTLRIRPQRQPKMTLREERSLAYRAAARLCGQPNQHINIGRKKK